MYDAYFCGAGGEETEWADLVVEGKERNKFSEHTSLLKKPVPI